MRKWRIRKLTFDGERVLERNCIDIACGASRQRQRHAHELARRLSPSVVIVSSDPQDVIILPDLIGCTIFRRYAGKSNTPNVALTDAAGTIKIDVECPVRPIRDGLRKRLTSRTFR